MLRKVTVTPAMLPLLEALHVDPVTLEQPDHETNLVPLLLLATSVVLAEPWLDVLSTLATPAPVNVKVQVLPEHELVPPSNGATVIVTLREKVTVTTPPAGPVLVTVRMRAAS